MPKTLSPSPKRAKQSAANRGRSLESLIDASRVGITILKIANGVRYLPGGKTIPTKSAVDFLGCLPGGRMVALDAKQCDDPARLILSTSTLKEHQLQQLLAFGRSGAISGILALSTATDRLFWLPYALLDPRPASLQWTALPDIGPASKTVDWSEVERAHNWFCDRRDGPLARAIAKHGPPFRVQIDRSLPVCDVRPVEYPESVEESF